jgi:tetratricopeptide (TPR) repeat protein
MNFGVMIIANPIYDIIFKRVMENKRVARFVVGTIIGEQVEEIAMVPQEYTYYAKVKKTRGKNRVETATTEEEWEVLSLIRFDFVATIRNADGEYKKILIEVQKSNNAADLMRFRTYLGEQYKRMDIIEVASGKVEKALPVISIYLLGFKLPEIEAVAIKAGRSYIDMIGQKEIKEKSEWIESLTHDGYFVQIPHINGKPRTLLEKILSVFEQKYFVDDKGTIKEYEYPVDDEEVKIMLEMLKNAAAEKKTRREMEEAWWAEKKAEELEKELQESQKALEEKDKALEEKDKALEEKDKALEEKDKALKKKDIALEAMQKEIERLKAKG